MSENEKVLTQDDFREEIIKKAHSDQDFKKALMENPKKTLEELGVLLPEDIEIKVVEESPKVVYLVLPMNLKELTDEQLNEVTGGDGAFPPGYDWMGNPIRNR